jgi:hypothetical protein
MQVCRSLWTVLTGRVILTSRKSVVALNCTSGPTSPNEFTSPRKHSGGLGSIPERHGGVANGGGRHGNAGNDVTGSSSVQMGTIGVSGDTSQPTSHGSHMMNNQTSTQGNVSSLQQSKLGLIQAIKIRKEFQILFRITFRANDHYDVTSVGSHVTNYNLDPKSPTKFHSEGRPRSSDTSFTPRNCSWSSPSFVFTWFDWSTSPTTRDGHTTTASTRGVWCPSTTTIWTWPNISSSS